jgi:hypothetical protein
MWTLYRTTAGTGMTSIRWAPSRSGIACPLGTRARLCRTFLRPDAGEAFPCSDAGKAGQPSPVADRGGHVLLARLASGAPVLGRIACCI